MYNQWLSFLCSICTWGFMHSWNKIYDFFQLALVYEQAVFISIAKDLLENPSLLLPVISFGGPLLIPWTVSTTVISLLSNKAAVCTLIKKLSVVILYPRFLCRQSVNLVTTSSAKVFPFRCFFLRLPTTERDCKRTSALLQLAPRISAKFVWLVWHRCNNRAPIFHWKQLLVDCKAPFWCIIVLTVWHKIFQCFWCMDKFIGC